ncbi:hypothetical protein [uncultured Paracoccus sp.]|uniref:hypothetical protein n=1 Tax=uncultured Paracoccus sp. TaxID=189685 RepID=UPI0012FFECA2|nr:hypothetical protein [uncultured Paracoccus sp.]
MESISDRVTVGYLPLVAKADFTIDMVRNLLLMFEVRESDNPVTIELREWGVWAVTAEGVRLFIGATKEMPNHAARETLPN